jgi:hypothetical protein
LSTQPPACNDCLISAMWTCPQCGASVAPTEPACRYCGTLSPEGTSLLREEHIRAEAEAAAIEAHLEHDHARAQAALDENARLALKWAIAGLVLCCVPVPAIVALVMAVRTQKAARLNDSVVPGRATAALVISAATLLLFSGAIAVYLVDSHMKESRSRELRDIAQRTWTSTVIDQATACALLELKVIESGFNGKSWTLGDSFACHGKIEQNGDRAVLHDAEVGIGGDNAHVVACMKRGERWMVEKVLREGTSCEPALPAAAASSAPPPRASAPPSSAAPARKVAPKRK